MAIIRSLKQTASLLNRSVLKQTSLPSAIGSNRNERSLFTSSISEQYQPQPMLENKIKCTLVSTVGPPVNCSDFLSRSPTRRFAKLKLILIFPLSLSLCPLFQPQRFLVTVLVLNCVFQLSKCSIQSAYQLILRNYTSVKLIQRFPFHLI